MDDKKAYEKNSSFSFQGTPENIDIEQTLNDTASNISYDPFRLTEILLEIGQKMTGIHLYSYQKPIVFRIMYSILHRDGAEITALFSRQSGKSEIVVFCVITLGVLLPVLAKIFPKELGHFSNGIKMGLLAPQGEQVDTIYRRCMERLLSEPVQMFLDDPDILDTPLSTVHFKLKSGSFLTGQSAAKQSKIESKTYHIVFLDESQDMDTEKVRRCVSADSIVYTDIGETTIENAVKNKLKIFSPSEGLVTPKNWFDNGEQKTYKVTLENGLQLTSTLNHKNRVIRRGRKDNKPFNIVTQELQIGDRLSVINELPHFGTKYSYEDGVLCGYMLGDGCMALGTAIKFYCFKPTYERLEVLLYKFNVDATISRENKQNGLLEVYITTKSKRDNGIRSNKKGSNDFKNFLKDIGIYGMVGSDKNINIEDKSLEFIKGLLEGLIETDGSVVLPKNSRGFIDFTNTSEGLVDTFKKGCHILGPHGNKISFDNNGSFGKITKKLHSVKIKDIRSIQALFSSIKLYEKQSKFDELFNRTFEVDDRNRCKFYNDWERFYKIVKIEDVGYKNTYCVEMPTDDHLWIVNGINTHNSIIPMTASTFGTIVRTGTPSRNKGDFYYTIQNNKKSDKKLQSKKEKEAKQLHFQYDYKEVIASKKEQYKKDQKDFHLLYEKAVNRDKKSMGENSDYFRMAYKIEWLLEIGMFISEEGLEEHCYDKRIVFPTVEKTSFVVAGLDIASARNDTVLTMGVVDFPSMEFGERPKKTLLNWLTLSGVNYEEQFHILVENLMANQVKVLYSDYTGVGRALTDILIYHLQEYMDIVPFTFTPSSKSDMWKALDEDIINNKVCIPAHKSIRSLKEFKSFEEQMTNLQKYWRGSFMVCEKTSGFSDDYCLSLDTEILTNNGFKNQKELTQEDLVASYNKDTQEIVFEKPLRIFKKWYSGEMIKLIGEHCEQDITADHKIIYQRRTTKDRKKIFETVIGTPIDIIDKKSFRTDVRFPISGNVSNNLDFFGEDKIRLLGWMITEGWVSYNFYSGGINRYFLAQSFKTYPEKCKKIEDILDRLGVVYGTHTKKNGMRFYQFKKESSKFFDDLLSRGIHTFPTDILYKLSNKELYSFYDTLMDADGCWSRKTFSNKDGKFIDGFSILCSLIGKGVNVKKRYKEGVYETTLAYVLDNGNTFRHIQNIEKYNYDGEVWCVTVNSGFIVTRKNNKITVTGNCDSLGLMNLAGNHLYTPPNEIEVTENTLINTGYKASVRERSRW